MNLALNKGCPSFRQRGAVLLAVLIVAIVLTVLVGSAARLLDTRIELALAAKSQAADIALVHGKTQELVYYAATGRRTFAGISVGSNTQGGLRDDDGNFLQALTGDEIREDGYIYTVDGLQYSLQNTSGLLPINTSFPFWLERWLQANGVSYLESNALLQGIADWADENDWRRPAGAEAQLYRQNELPEPTNYLFQHCGEVSDVLPWKQKQSLDDAFQQHCSTRRTSTLNLNSIPASLWQILFPNSAQKVLLARAQGHWITNYGAAINTEPSLQSISDQNYTLIGGSSTLISVKGTNTISLLEVEIKKGKLPPFTTRVR